MPIPTGQDRSLAAVRDLAVNVVVKLTTIRHSARTDRDKHIAALRETLQRYVDSAMALARDGEP